MKHVLTTVVVLAISGAAGLAQGGRAADHWVGAWSTALVVATPVAAPAARSLHRPAPSRAEGPAVCRCRYRAAFVAWALLSR